MGREEEDRYTSNLGCKNSHLHSTGEAEEKKKGGATDWEKRPKWIRDSWTKAWQMSTSNHRIGMTTERRVTDSPRSATKQRKKIRKGLGLDWGGRGMRESIPQ